MHLAVSGFETPGLLRTSQRRQSNPTQRLCEEVKRSGTDVAIHVV
jgi:hypothetical protein